MSEPDPYDVLEVHPSADLREIKKAYRRLARRYHPDSRGDDEAAARFIELQNAYETILRRRNLGAGASGSSTAEAPEGNAEPAEEAAGFEYEVDFGEDAESVDEEAPEPEPEPEEPGVWREYLEALRERLVAQLWSAALLTMAIAPLAVAGVLMYRTGRRWFLVSGLLWFVVLAVLRPDRWQRD